jgi:flagellar basal body-associated protein FliL
MSWTHDRSIRDNRLLLAVIIGIVLVVAAGGIFFRMSTAALDAEQRQAEEDRGPNALIQPAFRTEPLSVALFYPRDGMLASGTALAPRQADAQTQAREALAALFSDQRAAEAPVLRDVKLRAFYLDTQGTAYVDLTAGHEEVRASAWEEQLAVYAMVNTLMRNFEEIRQVAFLVDGAEAPSLAGHMDLSRTYGKRMDLVRQE